MAKTRDQKARDLRFILGATIGVLLGGIVIAAAILQVISKGPDSSFTRPIGFGSEVSVRENVRKGGPIFLPSPTGDDGFWVALEDDELVALLVRQPRPASCQLRWRGSQDTFLCDGRPVTKKNLARLRSFTGTKGREQGTFMVALRDVEPPPAGPPPFATSSSTTLPL